MINVILADHERIFRIGLASALAAEDDIRIVGQPSTPAQLLRSIDSFRPHVVLLSSAFVSHTDAIKLACRDKHVAILLLQDYGTPEWEASPGDFHGIMLRSTTEETVVESIRHVARGGRVLRVAPPGVPAQKDDFVGKRVRERLSAQELTIVAYIVQGYKNREIAVRTGISVQSIKNSLRKIYDKTGTFGRLELALFVMHHRTLLNVPIGALEHMAASGVLPEYFEAAKRPVVN